MTSTLRSAALARGAANYPTLPANVEALDSPTRERLEDFAAREGLTLPATLAVVRRARKAARTEARAAAVVATALDRRRRGLVGVVPIDPELDATTDAVVAETLNRRAAERSADHG
jgi:hypothetical protein